MEPFCIFIICLFLSHHTLENCFIHFHRVFTAHFLIPLFLQVVLVFCNYVTTGLVKCFAGSSRVDLPGHDNGIFAFGARYYLNIVFLQFSLRCVFKAGELVAAALNVYAIGSGWLVDRLSASSCRYQMQLCS